MRCGIDNPGCAVGGGDDDEGGKLRLGVITTRIKNM